MGLDTTHGAFHGAYSAFNRFRQAVCKAMGGSFPPHDNPKLDAESWYVGEGYSEKSHPGLFEFLAHSDCDGYITPGKCRKIAEEMALLLPALDAMGDGGGHIARDGGFGRVARTFIAGCELAAKEGKRLGFH